MAITIMHFHIVLDIIQNETMDEVNRKIRIATSHCILLSKKHRQILIGDMHISDTCHLPKLHMSLDKFKLTL